MRWSIRAIGVEGRQPGGRVEVAVRSSDQGDARGAAARSHEPMSEPSSPRLLVVANRTESAPRLLEEVKASRPRRLPDPLMVPPERHPEAPDWTPEDALSLMQRAAGDRPVTLVDCGEDAAATIGELVERGECDEILLCTPPEHHEHWHRHSLPKRIKALDIPVTVIPPDPAGWSYSTVSRRIGRRLTRAR